MKVINLNMGIYIHTFMSLKPETIIKKIKQSLETKGYKKDIPIDVWYAEFMYQTGYGKIKIHEWTENFELIKLIKIDRDKISFIED